MPPRLPVGLLSVVRSPPNLLHFHNSPVVVETALPRESTESTLEVLKRQSANNAVAPSKKQLDIAKVRLCAALSKFAYTSGDPELKISTDDELAKQTLSTQLAKFGSPESPPEIQDLFRFHSKTWLPWFIPWQNTFRWFRSYAYSCRYKTPENVDRIVVGFRGTWANTSGTGKWFEEVGMYQIY
ncbi:hypothetical protein LTR17_022468 [Elasticomyces elasticus]|nr:hypothetical protein LTR17_022468 [Elasticomyces elasticus]